jgi:hypothetical protein
MNRSIMVNDEMAFRRRFKTNISLLDHIASDAGGTDCSPGSSASGTNRRVTISAPTPLRSGCPPYNELAVRRSNEFIYSAL